MINLFNRHYHCEQEAARLNRAIVERDEKMAWLEQNTVDLRTENEELRKQLHACLSDLEEAHALVIKVTSKRGRHKKSTSKHSDSENLSVKD